MEPNFSEYLIVSTNASRYAFNTYDTRGLTLRRNHIQPKNTSAICEMCRTNEHRIYKMKYDREWRCICDQCRKLVIKIKGKCDFWSSCLILLSRNKIIHYDYTFTKHQFIPYALTIPTFNHSRKIARLDIIHLMLNEIVIRDIRDYITKIIIKMYEDKLDAYNRLMINITRI